MLNVQIKRGTTAENDAHTGAVGSLTLDSELKQLRLHDGTTEGGIKVPTIADIAAINDTLGDIEAALIAINGV